MILGWIIVGVVGALFGAAVIGFWDKISHWLNNTAANAVERVLGYGARQRMHRAISKIDRAMDVIRNRTVVYTKRHELDSMMDKVTMEADASPYEIDQQVLKEINQKGKLVQEFEYKQ